MLTRVLSRNNCPKEEDQREKEMFHSAKLCFRLDSINLVGTLNLRNAWNIFHLLFAMTVAIIGAVESDDMIVKL